MPRKKAMFESTIHVLRAKRRMTQHELAKKVGVSRQTIIYLEQNKFNPSLQLAYDIAKIFDTSIEQVFTFSKK